MSDLTAASALSLLRAGMADYAEAILWGGRERGVAGCGAVLTILAAGRQADAMVELQALAANNAMPPPAGWAEGANAR